MISVEQAEQAVFECIRHIVQSNKTRIPLEQSLGRILAQTISADRDQPPFHRVAMDGIAICSSASEQKSWSVESLQRPGEPQKSLQLKSNAIEIMTGAPLPSGCDCVIPYEHLNIKENTAELLPQFGFTPWQNIHQKGTDYVGGQELLFPGIKLSSAHLAVLASIGQTELDVFTSPRFAFISTGDELVKIDETPENYQIRQSNSCSMESELRSWGHFGRTEIFHLKDDEKTMTVELERICREFDVVVLSGGVSMGKFDFVPKVMKSIGAEEVFHKISQRPGKPLWFGRIKNTNTAIIGMPGNPVSSLISFRRYIIEALNITRKQPTMGVLESNIEFKKPLTYFLPVKIFHDDGKTICRPVKMNGSGDYYSLSQSDGFLQLDADQTSFAANDSYPLYTWGGIQ